MAAKKGIIRLAQFTPGLNTKTPAAQLNPGQATVCNNVDLSLDTVRRRNGWTASHAGTLASGADVTGLFDTTDFGLLAVAGNSLYAIAGGVATLKTSTLVTAPTLPLSCTFVEANGAVYIAVSDAAAVTYPVVKYNGTTAVASVSPGATGVTYYGNALWILGDTNHLPRLSWSGTTGISGVDVWPATNFLDFRPGDGDLLRGFGVINNTLIVLKERSVWRVTGQQPDDAAISSGTMLVTNMDQQSGCTGPYTVSSKDNVIIWMNQRGLFAYDGVSVKEITQAVRPWFTQLDQTALVFARGAWINWHQYMLVAKKQNGTTGVLVVTFNPNSITEYTVSSASGRLLMATPQLPGGVVNKVGNDVYFGFAGGVVGLHSSASHTDNGTVIDWRYTTGPLEMGPVTDTKFTRFGWFRSVPDTDNFTAQLQDQFSTSLGVTAVVTPTHDPVYTDQAVATTRVVLAQVGKAMQMSLSKGTGGQTGVSPEISEATFDFRSRPIP